MVISVLKPKSKSIFSALRIFKFLTSGKYILFPFFVIVGRNIKLINNNIRIPDIVKDGAKSLGQLYAIGHGLWFLIIGYHMLIGAASGPTAWVNIIITAIIGILYLTASRKPN